MVSTYRNARTRFWHDGNTASAKSAAFLSDLKDRWAVDWLRWNGYPKFWSQLVRETMRRRDDNEFDFHVTKDGDEAKISIRFEKTVSTGTNSKLGCESSGPISPFPKLRFIRSGPVPMKRSIR